VRRRTVDIGEARAEYIAHDGLAALIDAAVGSDIGRHCGEHRIDIPAPKLSYTARTIVTFCSLITSSDPWAGDARPAGPNEVEPTGLPWR